MKIAKQDWKYVRADPDPGFDPEHNQRVIDETIRQSKLIAKRKQRENSEKVKERAGAVASYLESVNTGKTNSSIDKYFGRHELARLRGENIKDIIRAKIGHETKEKIKRQAEIKANAL